MRDRYSQGSAAQEDVLRLEIEAEELNIEIERLRGQTAKTAAQLNALLNRRPDAPLARPAALRPLPNESKMRIAALVDRAVRRNPSIAEGEAKAGSASAMRELAERNRYPDINLGVMTTQDRDGYAGVGVMGEVRVPLQWGAKEAEVSAATAEQAAAVQRLKTLSFPKIQSGGIRAMRENQRIILSDVRIPSVAWDVCRQPLQAAAPA